ncbi:MAG TPA: ModD protein, partial [Alicycliphilus sp.]|nr:ModD protein [Alicycliphilus sp.]
FTVRAECVAACTEEAARIVQHCGGQVESLLPSGTPVVAGDVLLAATGDAAGLLRAWKVAQNLLEYACGVAGATATMVGAVRAAAPGVAVLTTRKHAPGLRRIALKATLSGGAFPHRLGVGETVLVFPQHRALLGGWEGVAGRLAAVTHALAEKKCVIEAHSLDEALRAAAAGADVVQLDKAAPHELRAWCPPLQQRYPRLRLLAAGGINPGNAADYAASGVDALVTSSLHYAPPADVGVSVQPL